MKSIAVLLLASSLTAACAVGPTYKRPPVTVPEQTRGQVSSAEAASLADQPWWEVFGDDSLKSLIDEALRNNYDVRAAVWRVEEFRARAGIARSELFPQIGYQGEWSRSRQSEFVQPGSTPVNLHDVNLGLSWEIDLWGRVRRLSEAALAQYLATREARLGVLLSVVSEVGQAYFELLELDAQLAIARRTTETFQGTYDLFNRQLIGGVTNQLVVSRAEAALATAAAAIPNLERLAARRRGQVTAAAASAPGTTLAGDLGVPRTPPGPSGGGE